jgi:hypothetical protein
MQKEQNEIGESHEDQKAYFSTRDLHLASTLITLGFFMEGIDYQFEGSRPRPVGYFNFYAVPEINDAVKKYRQCMLNVDAKTLFSNMKSLLAEVNNTYKNPHTNFVEQD